MKKPYSLSLDEEVIEKLEQEKIEKRLSPSWMVNELLRRKYKLNEKKED